MVSMGITHIIDNIKVKSTTREVHMVTTCTSIVPTSATTGTTSTHRMQIQNFWTSSTLLVLIWVRICSLSPLPCPARCSVVLTSSQAFSKAWRC